MDLKLKDRVALVTGSGQAIGRTIALALAADGAHVAVNDVNVKGLEETASLVRQLGTKAIAAPCDITNLDAVKTMANEVVPHDQLISAAERWVREILENAPLAVQFRKVAVECIVGRDREDCC